MPDSKAQVRWAFAAKEGAVKGDKKFANEVISETHGKKLGSLPEHAKKKPRYEMGKK